MLVNTVKDKQKKEKENLLKTAIAHANKRFQISRIWPIDSSSRADMTRRTATPRGGSGVAASFLPRFKNGGAIMTPEEAYELILNSKMVWALFLAGECPLLAESGRSKVSSFKLSSFIC